MTAPATRVVTFGECLLRLSPPPYERFLESPQFGVFFGGCEANVAVGLAHLGIPASYVSVLPQSAIGDAALAALRAEGVETGSIVQAGDRLGIYFIELGRDARASRVVYDRARSAFAHLAGTSFQWPAILNGAAWFHGSGITPALGAGPSTALGAAVAAARAAHIRVSIDLNYRPALWTARDPRPFIRPLVHDIELLIGNTTAVRAMLGIAASDDTTATPDGARALAGTMAAQFGARRVALTRRELLSENAHRWSASLYDAQTQSFVHSRTHSVRVVDRVGGGDSFAAALIASILRGYPAQRAVEFAVAASAHKLSVPGDFNRVTTDEVDKMLAQWT
jgi:2-dehydro-3-deoxygluconokinase